MFERDIEIEWLSLTLNMERQRIADEGMRSNEIVNSIGQGL